MDLPRLPLPEYMSIDEVYLNISNSQKYAFVIMDFSNGEIVDIVHNRWSSTLEDYFLHIPLEERLKVKAVICDAYQTYLTMPEKYFPNACTVLDASKLSSLCPTPLDIAQTPIVLYFSFKNLGYFIHKKTSTPIIKEKRQDTKSCRISHSFKIERKFHVLALNTSLL